MSFVVFIGEVEVRLSLCCLEEVRDTYDPKALTGTRLGYDAIHSLSEQSSSPEVVMFSFALQVQT
jgi:hypothetical protein